MKLTRRIALIGVLMPLSVCAADWDDCKQRKREALRLEQGLGKGKKVSGYSSGAAMKARRRELERWLRKNCRYYSNRLRDLERESM